MRLCVTVPPEHIRRAPTPEALRQLGIDIEDEDEERTVFSLEASARPEALERVGGLVLADLHTAEQFWKVLPCEED